MNWLAGLLLLLLMSGPVHAQDNPRPQKVDDLVRLLQDPEVRSWLDRVPTDAAQASNPRSDGLAAWESRMRERLDGIVQAIPRIPAETKAAAARTRQEALTHGGLPVFAIFLSLIAVGLVAEKLFSRSRTGSGVGDRLLAIAMFTAAMAVAFFAFRWPPLPRIVLLVSLLALVAYRTISVFVDTALMPSSFRRRAKLFIGVAIIGVALAVLGEPLSADPTTTAAVSFCVSIILLLLAIESVISSRIRSVRARIALGLAIVATWAFWCLGLHGLFWLAVFVMILPSVLRFVGRAAADILPAGTEETKRVLLVRGSRAIVVIIAVVWLATVWRLDPNSMVHSDPRVAAFSYGLLKSVVILLLADLVWHLAKSWIDRKLLASNSIPDGNELIRQGRLRTLLPIFRNVLAVMVAVITGLVVLSELGVEIGPLIAGAGVFGVALGFGSQTLVKDVISGVFYMLDDAFRVGEYIQAKSYKGTVEGFSLRSVRLRHHRGPVYTVPFGELGAVENMSRDWGVVKFRVSVSYDADVEKARKLTKKIGAALAEDAEFSALFIEPLKMKGVEEFGDYGMVLSFGMTLRPSGLQSMIRRRANLMIREAFKENGIEFAQPMVQVGADEKQVAATTAARLQEAKAAAVAPT